MSEQAGQSLNREELDLSDEVQTSSSGSWLGEKLNAAGFPSVDAFARQIGVPNSTACQWERGCTSNPPTHRPPARLLPVIAKALGVGVSLAEVIEHLSGEKDGDPCPCRCGGYKSFEHTPPEARRLWIVIPCAKCGTTEKRSYKPWKTDRHRKLCKKCGKKGERAEYTVARCRTCNRITRRPSSYFVKRFSFDPSLNTYQCNNCGSLERMRKGSQDEELRLHEAEALGKEKSQVKIADRKWLFSEHRHRMYGGKLKLGFSPEQREKGRRAHMQNAAAGKKYPKKPVAQLVRLWDQGEKNLPNRVGFCMCIHCGKFQISFISTEPNFHKPCHDQWERTEEGRRYQQKVMRWGQRRCHLPHQSTGRARKLKLHYSWAIKHYLCGKGYGTIAKEGGIKDRASVKDAITELINCLHAVAVD